MTTGVLCPTPILQFFDNQGNPAVGGSVLTQVGGGNAATYQDVGLTTPLPNPIPLNSRGEVSTSAGASAQCFLTPNTVYTFTLYDFNGNQLWSSPYVNGVQVTLTQSNIGAALWPYNAAFDGAPVVNTGWIYGDPRRFGAVGDGATDDTVALNNWALGGGALTLPNLNFLISDEIDITISGTSIQGCVGSKVTQSVANKSIFRTGYLTNNVRIDGVHFDQTAWGADAYVGQVVLDGSTNSSVENCEFESHQWAGVYLVAARSCTVRANYFHDSNPLVNVTFTSPPLASSTSATLNANWARASGTYVVRFADTAGGLHEGRAAVFASGSTTCTFSALTNDCDAAAVVQPATNSCDIFVSSSASAAAADNVIEGNFCYGNTMEVGISIQDPYSGVLPTRNVVMGNRVTGHLGYGILVYMPDSGESYNQIIGNQVENIEGSFGINASSGAGIYMVGAGAGGTIISGNTVRNCCIDTELTSLSPAAIGCAGTSAGTVPITIQGNTIADMTQYHGILCTGILGGASISGNTILHPAANSTGDAIRVTNSNNVSVTGNILTTLNISHSNVVLSLYANSADNTNITVSGNTLTGGHYAQIRVFQTGGNLNQFLSITGNTFNGCDTACIPLILESAGSQDVQITANLIQSSTAASVSITACVNVRMSNNRLKTTGTVALVTSGACTGGFYDRSNTGVLASALLNNAGTGFNVELNKATNIDPVAGTYAVGDIVWRTDATTGERILAACTNAAGAGTWKVVNLS